MLLNDPARLSRMHGLLLSKILDGPTAAGRQPIPPSSIPNEASEGQVPKRTPQLIFRLAVHEASHAVVRLYLGLGTITKISIDAPQGGYVMWKTSELQEQTEEFFTAVLASTWAGRAGEEVIIETVGASGGPDGRDSDQAVATQLAFDMETCMGFGQKWPLLYRATSDPQFLLAIDPELSERVHARLERAYQAALKMVQKQRGAIEHLAKILLLAGTLEGAELQRAVTSTLKLINE